MRPHTLLINGTKGTLKTSKSNNDICGAIQRSLLLKEFQATQGRSAHLALLRPAVLNRDSFKASGLISPVALPHQEQAAEGVCPSPPPLTRQPPVTVTHSDTDMPFRPRRGWGWPTLSSPGTNSQQQLCPRQTAVGPLLLFSHPT